MQEEKKTLRDYLIENGLEIEDCAIDTGISVSTLYKVWSYKSEPGYKTKKILKDYTKGQVHWD